MVSSIINTSEIKFGECNKKLLEEVIFYGISLGADFVELFIENSDNSSVLAEEDFITSVSPSFGKGAGIRIFKDKRDGFVSTNDLSKHGLMRSISQAIEMLDITEKTNNSIFNGLNKLKDYSKSKINWINEVPTIYEISEKLLLSTKCLKKDNKVVVRKGSYSRNWQEVIIASSDGTYATDIRLHQTVGLNLIANDAQYRSNGSRRFGSHGIPNEFRLWDHEKAANEVYESSLNMLYADYVQAGQMPVVLANKFGGVIFHEACGHLLETTQIERGTTPFSDKLNKKIAHESVTAIDEGLSEGSFGSLSIDDEGMEPEKSILIKNGILKKFLSDRAGELRTGHKRTGSGRRQNYSFAAASRMRNTYIAKGEFTKEELINSIADGLYCKSMGGGSVGATGQFNFAVEEGYLIKNGKLTKPVKGATLIGDAKEVMPKISMCGNDLELAPGFCGSVSGSVNVTVGQPHIKVDSITVGGR
ncbi:putative modulator of DNA gyrase; TldD [Prochlorococcus marinus str. MIT 9515]|uniref:Putative modulator of DNA gyrase TldD n=1 Tax=Prochlorococcus marinus (strain MIT 9515) TaxID=167542 RepID=A2BWG5_PROM5|nr:TldD/PmbA family protein [Prochlorococcus marinus]ABM72126.1 putative modulator of DNA gyrase; TldD [Prochlorococcus marinus str. MIT 9515]